MAKSTIHVRLDTTGLNRLRAGMGSLAQAAGEEITFALRSEIDRELSVMGPPRSNVGEPPHMETAILREAIRAEWSDRQGRVYIDPNAKGIRETPPARYGFYLEYGMGQRGARPFFLPAAIWVMTANKPLSDVAEAVARQIRYIVG